MDDQLKDGNAAQERPIDPLRRVFIPREAVTPNGTTVFRTMDGDVYCRLDDGSIRRTNPKVNGKQARKLRAKSRRKV
jgi:hypothetical protein